MKITNRPVSQGEAELLVSLAGCAQLPTPGFYRIVRVGLKAYRLHQVGGVWWLDLEPDLATQPRLQFA